MSDRVYLDTSALVSYALGLCGSPDARDQKGKQAIEGLLTSDDKLAASPITLAEFSSVMYTYLRSSEGWLTQLGEADVDQAEADVMGRIATGSIRVRNLGPRAFEMGMSYVGAISREYQRKMKAWDAIHLYEACRWARETDEQVVIATADSDFKGFLDVFPAFCKHVRVVNTTV